MPDVFLSYSRDDQATARRFAEALERAGFSVWWDQTLSAGEAFDEVTEKALHDARAVVVLWSKSSVASRWVRAECSQADENGTLVPVMIEPCNLPMKFKLTQTADLSRWMGDSEDAAWQSFLTGLRRQAGGVSPVSAPNGMRPHPTRRWSPWLPVGALAALLLIGGGAYWFLGNRTDVPVGADAGVAAPIRTVFATIAVLPFANLSSDPEQENFVDGLTEEIINSLANLRGLQVTGRTSSFQFKGNSGDMKAIGEKLGVEYLLEGTVRRSGDRLKITAQLIKASDGFHLWSQPYDYDRPMADLIAFQEVIARRVAEALQVTLGVGDMGHTPGMTRNVEAYRLWLEGNALLSEDDFDQAAARYESAIALDPSFALAWAMLGEAAGFTSVLTGMPSPRSAEAIERANQLLPDSATYYLSQASDALERYAWKEVEEHLGRARAAGGRASAVAELEGILLRSIDRGSQVHELALRAYQRDPLNAAVVVNLATSHLLHTGGDYNRARALLREARALDPKEDISGPSLGIAMLQKDRAGIETALDADIQYSRFDDLGVHAAVRPLLDRPAAARAMLRGLLPRADDLMELFNIAGWSAYFDDPELALEALRKISTLNPGRGRLMGLLIWRNGVGSRSVRALPGFKTLLREMNLVDYWRTAGWGEHCRPVGDDFECS